MKKLVYLAAVAFAVSMVACGGSEKKEAAAEEAVPEVVEVVEEEVAAVDTIAPDTEAEVVAEAVEAAPVQ